MRHRRSGPKCLRPNGYVERCSLNDGCFDESEHPAGDAAPGPPPRKPPAPAGWVCGEENCVDEDGFVMDNNCPQNIPSTWVNVTAEAREKISESSIRFGTPIIPARVWAWF